VSLSPTSYHTELLGFLQKQEPELWQWFSEPTHRTEATEGIRRELLTTSYRLDGPQHAELLTAAKEAAEALGITVPITLYQSQESSPSPNASICRLPEEIHIVFYGSMLGILRGRELQAVLGHELAHFILWQHEGGVHHTVDRLAHACASDPRAHASHLHSVRRLRLNTELFADRGALQVTGDLAVTVAALVKTATGLAEVSGESYLKQAAEVCDLWRTKSMEQTHPELFLRAHCLALWHDRGAEAEEEIERMINGPASLDELDLPAQEALSDFTRRVLAQLLRPRWFRSDLVMAHAHLFFPDFQPDEEVDASLESDAPEHVEGRAEYFAAVLMDFATVDEELDDMPLRACLLMSSRLGIEKAFDKLAGKELDMKAREIKALRTGASEVLAKQEEGQA
jgi:hypothetical protein